MLCPQCKKEIPGDAGFCPECGYEIINNEKKRDADSCSRFAKRFSSPLFLAVCIFSIVSAIIPAFSGKHTSFDIIRINPLYLIAAICAISVYICAVASPGSRFGVKLSAIVSRVMYVSGWVIFGIITVAAVTMTVFSTLAVKYPEKLGELVDSSVGAIEEIDENSYEFLDEAADEVKAEFGITTRNGVVRLVLIVTAVILFIAALFVFVFNFCLMRHINKYIQNLRKGTAAGGIKIFDRRAAASFLILGVVPALGGLSLITAGTFGKMFLLSYFVSCIAPIIMFFVINTADDKVKK